VAGVKEVGPIGLSSVSIVLGGDEEPLDISLIGVEPGKPGEPPAFTGKGLERRNSKEAVIDKNVALLADLKVGDRFTIQSIQGKDKEYYTLEVVGISDGRKYGLRPSVSVPYLIWDKMKPQLAAKPDQSELISNVAAVQLYHPEKLEYMSQLLESEVSDIQVIDRKTAYESTPGYSAQQSTLNTQRFFALLIGTLVIGGFFHIQTLQKVGQVGMLKAIGTSNLTIVAAAVIQIVVVNVLGVAMGSVATLGLSLGFPPNIPIVFTVNSAATAISSLLIIGPMGGLVSIRFLLKVEPLIALGLSS